MVLKGSWGGQALSRAAQLDHLLIVVSNAIVAQEISDCLSLISNVLQVHYRESSWAFVVILLGTPTISVLL